MYIILYTLHQCIQVSDFSIKHAFPGCIDCTLTWYDDRTMIGICRPMDPQRFELLSCWVSLVPLKIRILSSYFYRLCFFKCTALHRLCTDLMSKSEQNWSQHEPTTNKILKSSTVPENAFPELLGHAHLPEPGRWWGSSQGDVKLENCCKCFKNTWSHYKSILRTHTHMCICIYRNICVCVFVCARVNVYSILIYTRCICIVKTVSFQNFTGIGCANVWENTHNHA